MADDGCCSPFQPAPPLGRLLPRGALDQCANLTVRGITARSAQVALCVHRSRASLLEETSVADGDLPGCAFCVMHVVAIPDHRTQISRLHNLHCLTVT